MFRVELFSLDCPCSYYKDRNSHICFVSPKQISAALYDTLTLNGFRRDADYLYRPVCTHCRQCLATRLDAAAFHRDRTMRKVARRNADLTVRVRPLTPQATHFALFSRYEQVRHGGTMAKMSFQDYAEQMANSAVRSQLLEFSLKSPQDRTDTVVMVSIIDIIASGVSAVYTFYDPALADRSLGIYAILYEIELVRSLNLPYLYLGYWLPGFPRMDYKRRFRPMEVFHEQRWIPLDLYLKNTSQLHTVNS